MDLHSDYGRMMAISQILFGQYHIWDYTYIFGLGLKRKVFIIEKTTESSKTMDK